MTTPLVDPVKIYLPFSASGEKNTVATASQIGVVDGRISLADGFPPLTSTEIKDGGVPPSRLDFNGILNRITQHTAWQNSGGWYQFDADLAAYTGGYQEGMVVFDSGLRNAYISLVDNNLIDFNTHPESIGAQWGLFAGYSLAFESEIVINTDQTIVPILSGPVTIYNTAVSGIQIASMNVSEMTIGKSILSAVNLSGGTTQIITQNNVALNPVASTNASAKNWSILESFIVNQGLWSAAYTSYGRRSRALAVNEWSEHGDSVHPKMYCGSVTLSPTLVVYVQSAGSAYGAVNPGSASITAYNPVTKTYGSAASLSYPNAEGNVIGVYARSPTAFIVILNNSAVAGSVDGTTITLGAEASLGFLGSITDTGRKLLTYSSSEVLEVGSYIVVGQKNSTNLGSRVLTVTGTTIVVEAMSAGPTLNMTGTRVPPYSNAPNFTTVCSGSSTSCLVGWFDSHSGEDKPYISAISRTGTTVSWGSAVIPSDAIGAITRTKLGAINITKITSSTYFCAYTSSTTALGIRCCVVSVSGTTATPATSAGGSTDTHTFGCQNIQIRNNHTYPYSAPSMSTGLRVMQYNASTFIVMGLVARIYTVSGGTTLTAAGSSFATSCLKNIDESWFYWNSSTAAFFTVSGSSIVTGGIIKPTALFGNPSAGSLSLIPGERIKVGATWYDYKQVTLGMCPSTAKGDGIGFSSVSSWPLTSYLVDMYVE
jgi:hypothetical protein